jgi:DNA-binding winged helix-turn-helix (wHTH) protein
MVRKRFALGPFLLDTGREVLYEHGVPVAIGRKAYALLRALVEARGDVVTKAALMEAAWPNISVEESNLTVQIAALRRRLRASNGGEDPIETFSRIGYRLAAPLRIEECEASAAHSPADTPQPASSSTRRQIRLEAYDLFVRGRSLIMHSPGGNRLARSYLIKAIGLEPEFAPAHAFLACSYNGEAVHYGVEVDANRAIGLACARTAVSVDPNDPVGHWALGYVRFYGGELHEAQREFETALRMDPDQADAL